MHVVMLTLLTAIAFGLPDLGFSGPRTAMQNKNLQLKRTNTLLQKALQELTAEAEVAQPRSYAPAQLAPAQPASRPSNGKGRGSSSSGIDSEVAVGGCNPTTFYEYFVDHAKGEQYCQESLDAIQKLNLGALRTLYDYTTNSMDDGRDVGTVKVSLAPGGYVCGGGGAAVYKIELCLTNAMSVSAMNDMVYGYVGCDQIPYWKGSPKGKAPTNMVCYDGTVDEDDLAAAE